MGDSSQNINNNPSSGQPNSANSHSGRNSVRKSQKPKSSRPDSVPTSSLDAAATATAVSSSTQPAEGSNNPPPARRRQRKGAVKISDKNVEGTETTTGEATAVPEEAKRKNSQRKPRSSNNTNNVNVTTTATLTDSSVLPSDEAALAHELAVVSAEVIKKKGNNNTGKGGKSAPPASGAATDASATQSLTNNNEEQGASKSNTKEISKGKSGDREKTQKSKQQGDRSKKQSNQVTSAATGRMSKNPLTNNQFVCSICSTEGVAYFAIGHCNHAICSLCALRMRCKSKDRSCALCKATLDVMIVYPSTAHQNLSTGQETTFYEFGVIPSSYSPPLPNTVSTGMSVEDVLQSAQAQDPLNIQVDHEQQMIYVSCREHFFENGFVKSIHCCCPLISSTGEQGDPSNAHPQQQQCTQRCSSYAQLCQHVSNMHQGMAMCQLCLENRPLFVHEHEIFPNKKALKDHMKGGSNVATVKTNFSRTSDVEHYTLGHPMCQFCSINVFDKHALYLHMQREHITCHLCDSSMMFRYYKNVEQLREHHRKDHFMCSLCDSSHDMRSSDISYAYCNFEEFSAHMKDCHGIRDSSRYLLGSRKFKESNQPSANEMYFDLDLGAANPVPVIRARAAAAAAASTASNNASSASSTARNDIVSMIPANMRIAGRVTGTGTFSMADQDLIALQAAADAANAASANAAANARATSSASTNSYASRLSQHRSTNMSGAKLDELFPALSVQSSQPNNAASNATSSSTTNEPQKPHPLSLVGKKPAVSAAATAKEKKAIEDRRIARNLQLAEAFGLLSGSDQQSNSSEYVAGQYGIPRRILRAFDGLGIPITSTTYQDRARETLKDWKIYPASSMFNFLFPIELLQWAKKQRNELLKIERKIATVLSTPADDSVNLKPMEYNDRVAVHCLAKYYHLFSAEYDPEPIRYICLTKTADSYLVPCSLSSVVGPSSFYPFVNVSNNAYYNSVIRSLSIQQQKQRGPVIYLVLNEGLLAQWGRMTDKNAWKGIASPTPGPITTTGPGGTTVVIPPTSFHYGVVVFAEVLMSLRALCLDNNLFLEDVVESFHYCGGNAIALQCHLHLFDDGNDDNQLQVHLRDAIYLAKFLIHVSATMTSAALDPANSSSTSSYQEGDFLRYFRVHTDFEIPKDEEQIAGGSASSAACGADDENSDGFVVINEKEPEMVEDEQDSGRPDAWDDGDSPSATAAALPPPGPNAYKPPQPAVSLAHQRKVVKDDWEEEDDEWVSFLAERRQMATDAGKEYEPYRPRLLPEKEESPVDLAIKTKEKEKEKKNSTVNPNNRFSMLDSESDDSDNDDDGEQPAEEGEVDEEGEEEPGEGDDSDSSEESY